MRVHTALLGNKTRHFKDKTHHYPFWDRYCQECLLSAVFPFRLSLGSFEKWGGWQSFLERTRFLCTVNFFFSWESNNLLAMAQHVLEQGSFPKMQGSTGTTSIFCSCMHGIFSRRDPRGEREVGRRYTIYTAQLVTHRVPPDLRPTHRTPSGHRC